MANGLSKTTIREMVYGTTTDMTKITIERETLLPCPFCGDDGDKGRQEVTQMIEGRNKFARITCRACGAMCPEENWNRRAALAAQPVPAAVPLTDEKIDHTLATTLDEFARTTRGMSHALDVNADITANSRLRRMFARAVLAAAGDKP